MLPIRGLVFCGFRCLLVRSCPNGDDFTRHKFLMPGVKKACEAFVQQGVVVGALTKTQDLILFGQTLYFHGLVSCVDYSTLFNGDRAIKDWEEEIGLFAQEHKLVFEQIAVVSNIAQSLMAASQLGAIPIGFDCPFGGCPSQSQIFAEVGVKMVVKDHQDLLRQLCPTIGQ